MDSDSSPELCVPAFQAFARVGSRATEQDEADEERRLHRLESLLRSEILPRLADLHHPLHADSDPVRGPKPTAADIERFCSLLIAPDADQATAFANRTAERGLSFEALIEGLITPAARRLGELWHEDRFDFFDVTFGVARLQELIDVLGPQPTAERESDPRALLLSLPGDTHFFGLDIVAAFLRAANWSVTMQHGLTLEESAEAVAREPFALVALTVGGKPFLEPAARMIETVRHASSNPDLAVMVGGEVFNRRPELAARVGADGTAPDGATAVVLARRLLLRQGATAR